MSQVFTTPAESLEIAIPSLACRLTDSIEAEVDGVVFDQLTGSVDEPPICQNLTDLSSDAEMREEGGKCKGGDIISVANEGLNEVRIWASDVPNIDSVPAAATATSLPSGEKQQQLNCTGPHGIQPQLLWSQSFELWQLSPT
jgi:hypothetical protein